MNTFLRTLDNGFIVVDDQWRVTSAAGPTGLNHDPASWVGRVLWEVFPGLVGRNWENHLRSAMSQRRLTRLKISPRAGKRFYEVVLLPLGDGLVIHGRDVTERSALAETRALLDVIVGNIPNPMFVKDLEGRYTLVNAATAAALGRTMGDVIGCTDAELMDAQAAAALRELDEKVVSERRSITAEERVTVGKGTRVYLSTKSPHVDALGHVVGVIGIARDITEHKAAEEELRDTNETLRTLVQASPFPIVVLDPDGRTVRLWNRAAQRVFGWSEEEVLGRPVPAGVPPEVWESLRGAAASNESFSAEIHFQRKDGAVVDAQLSAAPMHAADGSLNGIVVMVEDVTRRRQVEREARQQYQLMRTITDNATAALFMMDAQGKCTYMNTAAEQMCGYTLDEVRGRVLHDVVHHHCPDGTPYPVAECPIDRAISVQEPLREHEDTFVRKDGQFFPVQCSAVPIMEGGRATGTVVEVRDLTERRRAEERFRLVVEAAPSGMLMVDQQGAIMLVNSEVEKLFGYSRQELVGRPIEVLVPERFRAGHPGHRHGFASDPRTRPMGAGRELFGLRKDGSELPVEIGLNPIETDQGVFVLATIVDITERKRAAEERSRLAAIVTSSDDAIISKDLDGTILSWNPGAERLFGYRAEEVVGSHISVLFASDEEMVEERRIIDQVRAGDRIEPFESRRRRRDGTLVDVSLTISPIRDAAGRIVAASTVAHDISRRKQTESSLKEQAHILNILNRVANALNAELELEAVVQMVTDAGTELSGARHGAFFTRQEDDDSQTFRPLTFSRPDMAVEEDSPLIPDPAAISRLFGHEGVIRIADASQDPDYAALAGPANLRSFLAAPVISRGGGVLGGLLFAHPEPDIFTERAQRLITGLAAHAAVAIDNARLFRSAQSELAERRRAEEELESLNRTLEQRVAERTAEAERRAAQLRNLSAQVHRIEQRERRRLAQVLHDHLQQLLVAGMIQLDLAAKARGRTARLAAERASDLVRESIEVSRSLTAELSPPVLYEGSLTTALKWLGRHMEERHGLHVEVRAPDEELADGLSEERRVMLFQAARELLFNVVKHAGVDQASLSLTRDEQQIQLTIEDYGRGLDPAGAGQARPDGGGFGLLSMNERVEQFGGRCEVQTEPGRFTRVRVTIPMEPAAMETEPVQPEHELFPMDEQDASKDAAAPAPRRSARKRLRVLLADDHKVLRDGLVGLLRGHPNIIIIGEAADGLQAVDLARKLRPDVIIMDVSMPGLSGVEATRIIMRQVPGTRIVGLSMHDEADMTASMLEAGAETYLTKGGPAQDLITAILGPEAPPASEQIPAVAKSV